ncbi:MAG TPA: hypothetical protein VJT73_01830 [Polyangiaceae bacterium]|nr:hypothetical protein [Polyangiaceae bacterium]
MANARQQIGRIEIDRRPFDLESDHDGAAGSRAAPGKRCRLASLGHFT